MEKTTTGENGGRVMRTAKASRRTTNDYVYITEDIGWIGRATAEI
jgi:hypothetical protein